MHEYAVSTAGAGEVVNVDRTNRGLKCVVNFWQRYPEGRSAHLVDVRSVLRHGCAIEGIDARKFTVLTQGGQESVKYLAEFGGIVIVSGLKVEFETAGGSDTADGRRIHDETKALAGLSHGTREHAAEFFGAILALIPRDERDEDRTRVGLFAAANQVEPADGESMKHFALRRRRGHDFRDDLRHVSTRARNARAVGQRNHAENIPLVFGGNKTPRNRANQQNVSGEDCDEDSQRGLRVVEQPAHGAPVPGGDGIETGFEPAKKAVTVRGFGIPRTQDEGAKSGRKGQGDKTRNHDRDGDRDGELTIKSTGNTAQESNRHENRYQHEHNRDNCAAHFAHGSNGGVERRHALLMHESFDVLQHHDCVVHDDTNRDHHGEERQRVDPKAEKPQAGEGADQ